jgi:uncharacterized membrane protein YedE/YeeE
MILESPLLASTGLKPGLFFKWTTLFTFVVAIFLSVAAIAGLRFGLMILIGLGFGATLEGFRFGFAGPWRAMITKRDPAGIWAQLLAIGMVAIFAIPLIQNHSSEITGAAAPIGYAMVLGAFVFGAAMQVVLGCGSGTLVNAGSGNIVALIALPFFALGSFLGAYHLFWWTDLGVLPVQKLTGWGGVGITLAMICFVAIALWWKAEPQFRRIPKRLIFAALIVSFLALANLVVAGQPWGVVYGLGLWVAKSAHYSAIDLSGSVFWAAPASLERINASVLTDYTSLTNIGIVMGAFLVAFWRGGLSQPVPKLRIRAWVWAAIAGLLMGYASRLAFGCNVGAFFSGISTGSLHGWVWFIAAFIGSYVGILLRPRFGLDI